MHRSACHQSRLNILHFLPSATLVSQVLRRYATKGRRLNAKFQSEIGADAAFSAFSKNV
jgi:hypothetical protein